MGELFGTDGIRGVAGHHPLDADTVFRTGLCLAGHLAGRSARPHILLARDTRESGPWIESLLVRAVEEAGGIAETCGVLSTPAVSFLATAQGAHAGVMISASHNPYQDNGIKIFSSTGMKFNDAVEAELEQSILSCAERAPQEVSAPLPPGAALGFWSASEYLDLYTQHLKGCVAPEFSLRGRKLAVDCAHGSLSAIAPGLLRDLGADVHAIHCEPDGRNINLRAGALHLERLQEEVMRRKAQLGVAFDGDGDRAMFVDSGGAVRDGDDILYLLALYGEMGPGQGTVVGTVMANLGLEIALRGVGLELIRTAVGDRYVLEEMLRRGAVLGGEQSGHVIMTRHARTGDGLLTALKVLEILAGERRDIADLCRPLRRYPQLLVNVPVREKVPLDQVSGLRETEAGCRELLGPNSRIVLRYSGTEKLMRVMVEGESEERVREAASRLASLFPK